jgi:hypothetical protein
MENLYELKEIDGVYELKIGVDFEMNLFQFMIENAMSTDTYYDVAMIMPHSKEVEELRFAIGKVLEENEFQITDEFSRRRINKQFVEFYGRPIAFDEEGMILLSNYQEYVCDV